MNIFIGSLYISLLDGRDEKSCVYERKCAFQFRGHHQIKNNLLSAQVHDVDHFIYNLIDNQIEILSRLKLLFFTSEAKEVGNVCPKKNKYYLAHYCVPEREKDSPGNSVVNQIPTRGWFDKGSFYRNTIDNLQVVCVHVQQRHARRSHPTQ